MSDLEAYGQDVKAARERKGLTKKAAADACGITSAFLGDIERGARFPGPVVAEAIERELGVPVKLLVVVLKMRVEDKYL